MIAGKHRFHGLGSLKYAYNNGTRVRNQHLSLQYAFNKRRQTYRAAVVVSKKVNKSAVVRNRIRRRIYEIIRQHEQQLGKPLDIIITVYSEAVADMPAKQLDELVSSLLSKIDT